MAERSTAILGIYLCPAGIKGGVEGLKAAGFPRASISVLLPEIGGSRDFACEKDAKAPEGTAADEETRALIRTALEWLDPTGSWAIPGFGLFIAVGPIMTALAGVNANGAVDGITGGLIGMGIPEYEAKRYEGRVMKGGILLSVRTDSSEHAARAMEILEQTGAQDISSTEEANGGVTRDGERGVEATPGAMSGEEMAGPSRNMAGPGVERSV